MSARTLHAASAHSVAGCTMPALQVSHVLAQPITAATQRLVMHRIAVPSQFTGHHVRLWRCSTCAHLLSGGQTSAAPAPLMPTGLARPGLHGGVDSMHDAYAVDVLCSAHFQCSTTCIARSAAPPAINMHQRDKAVVQSQWHGPCRALSQHPACCNVYTLRATLHPHCTLFHT